MDGRCFPDEEFSPLVNHPFVCSTTLSKVPALSGRDLQNLSEIIDHLRENEEDEGSQENILPEGHSEEEEMDADDGDAEPVDMDSQESMLDALLAVFASANTDTNARAPPKRNCDGCRVPPAKKTRQGKKVSTIVKRVSPFKPPGDDRDYSVITLSNGLRAVLIRKPYDPASNQNEFSQLKECLETISGASEQQKKFHDQKSLPDNFPMNFPLVNQPLAHALTKILEKVENSEKMGAAADAAPTPRVNSDALCNFAVTVNVGCTDDPKHCQGLAHFTEHLVHYGSTTYSNEEEYFTFAINHGYGFNAFTENHTTTYFNTVSKDCLDKGLDMMANMLGDPIFKEDMTVREVNAVDSEFNLKRHIEFLRRWYLLQTSLGDHPLGKFGCGNKDTLLESRKVIRDFHAKHYVASSMTFCLESNLPIASQEKIVLNRFGDLPEGQRKILRETRPSPKEKDISGKDFNKHYTMQGLCTFSNIWLVWPIPEAFLKENENKSLSVLMKILRDQGEGSLAHYLRNQQYIWLMLCNFAINSILMDNKYTSFITMDFFLTPEGEAHVDDILKATFSYIKDLSKIADAKFQQVFDEMKLQEDRNRKLGADSPFGGSPFSHSVQLAKELQLVAPEDILKDDSWLWKDALYHQKQIHTILEYMQPDNMIVVETIPVTTNLTDYKKGQTVRTAPYTGAKYVVQPVKKGSGNHHFPNIINNDANLQTLTVPPEHHGVIQSQDIEVQNLWGVKVIKAVHLGNKINNYRSICLVNYMNSEVFLTARSFAMSLLWTASVFLSLMEFMDNDTLYLIVPHPYGISIGVIGYHDSAKLLENVEKLNDQFFKKPVTEKWLKMAKQALDNVYDLMFACNAELITQDLLHFMTCNHTGDVLSDAVAHLKDCSAKDINSFSSAFKSKAMAFLVVAGNVSVPTANDVIDLVNKQGQEYAGWFSLPRLVLSEFFRKQPCHKYKNDIHPGERCIRIKSDLCYSYFTTVKNFYYIGKYEPSEYVLCWNSLYYYQLRAFINLRMKKQLGYAIQVYFPKPEENQPMVIGVGVAATASKFSPCELDKHLDEFMVDYGKFLGTVDEEMFACLKEKRGYNRQTVEWKLADARAWYVKHFGQLFASNDPNKFILLGMSKISIQILGNDCKKCQCGQCEEIVGWVRNELWNHFEFAKGEERDKGEAYFVDDPKKIRNGD